jgi:hypothetical protein
MTDDKLYRFPVASLFPVMERMKQTHPFIAKSETQHICEAYHKLFPPTDGVYHLSVGHVTALVHAIRDQTLLELVDLGHLEMSWDDKTEEFVFAITEKGREAVRKERGE